VLKKRIRKLIEDNKKYGRMDLNEKIQGHENVTR
jgi:hypothetical protein